VRVIAGRGRPCLQNVKEQARERLTNSIIPRFDGNANNKVSFSDPARLFPPKAAGFERRDWQDADSQLVPPSWRYPTVTGTRVIVSLPKIFGFDRVSPTGA
jgi:hypothetical protein